MTLRFASPVSLRRRQLVSTLPVAGVVRRIGVAPLWTAIFNAALARGA
ncbi:hypothetical protein PQR75_07485 [Paraburkholderia fungorum]|jgi:hypothetical protein